MLLIQQISKERMTQNSMTFSCPNSGRKVKMERKFYTTRRAKRIHLKKLIKKSLKFLNLKRAYSSNYLNLILIQKEFSLEVAHLVEIWPFNSIHLFPVTSKEYVVLMHSLTDVQQLCSQAMLSCPKLLNHQHHTVQGAQQILHYYMIIANHMLIGSTMIY